MGDIRLEILGALGRSTVAAQGELWNEGGIASRLPAHLRLLYFPCRVPKPREPEACRHLVRSTSGGSLTGLTGFTFLIQSRS